MEHANTAMAVVVANGLCESAADLADALKDVLSSLKDRETLLEESVEELTSKLASSDISGSQRKVLEFARQSLKAELHLLQDDSESESEHD